MEGFNGMTEEVYKICNSCLELKNHSEFYIVKKRGKLTIFHICKDCSSTQKTKMAGYYRDWELKKKYGISLEEYQQESSKRENRCDICSRTVKSLHVDHNHTTGKVRGYLCGSCNRGIGLLQDSISILEKATTYLKTYD